MKKLLIAPAIIIFIAALLSFTTGGVPDMYMVNTSASIIKWKTSDDSGKASNGTIKFKSGNIKIDTKTVVGGFAYANMQTLDCQSISDAGFNKAKVDEMRSAAVMDVVKYKEMTFKIIKAVRKDVAAGQPNYDLTFQLSLKGIKKSITTPATIELGKKSATLNCNIILQKDEFSLPSDIELLVEMETTLKK